MKVRKKPVIVEAVQWNGTNVVEVYNFLEDEHAETQYEVNISGKNFYIKFENETCRLGTLMIKTLEGEHKASIGDYIIKGVNGEFYPCKPDIFEKTYEVVEDDGFNNMGFPYHEQISKIVRKMSVIAMNEKELIISEWLEMNGEKISEITREKYSFDDLKKKLEEYMIMKEKETSKKPEYEAELKILK